MEEWEGWGVRDDTCCPEAILLTELMVPCIVFIKYRLFCIDFVTYKSKAIVESKV